MAAQIITVAGSTFKFDDESKLAELRAYLKQNQTMADDDRFEYNSGAIELAQEQNLTVKEILKDNKNKTIPLKIKPKEEPTPTVKPVDILVAGKSFKFSPDKTLVELRTYLKQNQAMTDDDRFEYNSGAIELAQEQDFTVKEILKDGKISLKTKSKKNPVIQLGKTPETPKANLPQKDLTSKPDVNTSTEDKTNIIPSVTASLTNGLQYFQDLSFEEKQDLYRRFELCKALIYSKDGLSKSFKEAIKWKVATPDSRVPRMSGFVTATVSYTRTAHELVKFGADEASANVGAFGVSGSASYRKEQENRSREEKFKIFMLATYTVPKVDLSISISDIYLDGEFISKIKANLKDKTKSSYQSLINLLNEYGYFVPMRFSLGGQLFSEDNKEIQDFQQSESEKESFAVAFQANLTAFGYPISAGASYGKTSGTSEAKRTTTENRTMSLTSYGGDAAATQDPGKWMGSLGSYKQWQVVGYDKVIPIVYFFPPNLRDSALWLLNKFAFYPTMDKPILDLVGYATDTESLTSRLEGEGFEG